ncbi:tyrosine-type recombinase/integrase [Nocardiopsis dassonvillei]|uniref:tyrosine-type recombinase/integrase n=1 Tax=Nocardiopsis dassonvillei TaxID=2014 RepID=UPI00362CF4E5
MARVELGYRNGKRQRQAFYGATPEEALEKKKAWLAQKDAGFTPPKGRAPWVAEWVEHWLLHIAQARVDESTFLGTYSSKVRRHIIPYFSRVRLTNEDLHEELIEQFHTHLRDEKGLAPATIVQVHRILSMACKAAVIRGRLIRNPCINVSPPKIRREEVVVPDREEVSDILTMVAGQRMAARWLWALAAGPRQGETLGLMWHCLDLDDAEDAQVSIDWELVRLPWRHGCEDSHACGAKHHRLPCPAGCTKHQHKRACTQDCANPRHRCKRPCPADCTVHQHEDDCKHNCSRRAHVCPTFCTASCTGHARACPAREGGGLVLKRPKTAKSQRTYRIPPLLAKAFLRHRKEQKAEREALGEDWVGWAHEPHTDECPKGCRAHCDRDTKRRERVCPECHRPTKPDALVFTQPSGRPINAREDWQEWKDILASLDLDDWRVHDMRHRAATALLEAGEDVRVVQAILGHADPAFTQRTYQHVTDRLQRRAANKMASGLGSFADAEF